MINSFKTSQFNYKVGLKFCRKTEIQAGWRGYGKYANNWWRTQPTTLENLYFYMKSGSDLCTNDAKQSYCQLSDFLLLCLGGWAILMAFSIR